MFANKIIKNTGGIDATWFLDINFDCENIHGFFDYKTQLIPKEYRKYCDYDPNEYDVYLVILLMRYTSYSFGSSSQYFLYSFGIN